MKSMKHVVGYGLLVVLATAGGAQASTAIPGTNRVDSGDIRNGQVKTADLAPNAVKSSKVRNRSIKGVDLKRNTLTGAEVKEKGLDMSRAGCQVGLVHSYTQIPAGLPGDSVWRDADNGHNCSGGQILVRRTGSGHYEVRFVGDPATMGVATPVSGYNSIGVRKNGDVFALDQRNMDGTLVTNAIGFVTY